MNKQRFWGFFAHTSIIIGMMFVIFFVIDRFNPAMEFLSSNISKWLILIFAICSILNGLFSAVFLFQKQKRHEEKRGNAPPRATPNQIHAAQRSFAQPQYDTHDNIQRQRTPKGRVNANGYPTQQRPPEQRQYRHAASALTQPNMEAEHLNPRAGQ
ncbi:MAG TPA: hypothetical protein P5075_03185 [Eubacteriales bacterium]|nr:hypothetical protein [Eubacteriales bacterium]